MQKVLDLAQFISHMAAATRKAGYQVEKQEGVVLWLKLHGTKFRCDLSTAYGAYRGSPDRLDDIVKAHLSALKKVPPAPPPPNEKEAAESLLPMLQQSTWVQSKAISDVPTLFQRPFVTGIVVSYVFDFPAHRAYLNLPMAQRMMGEGKHSFESFHEYALNNLRLRVAKHNVVTVGAFTNTIISCETHDGYAATSVLLPEMLESWAKKIPGRMLIGISNRDFIIAFSDQNPSGVEGVAGQVRRDASQRQHPLLSRLLLWQDGKIKEYGPLH